MVPGRSDKFVVAQLIASFTHEDREQSHYLVETPAGERWILFERQLADGPKWIGSAILTHDKREKHE